MHACICMCQWDFHQTVADVDQTMYVCVCVCVPIFVTVVAGVYQGSRLQGQSPAIQGKCPDSSMYVCTRMCVHVLCVSVCACAV